MPKILTDKYRDATFCIPYTADKSECAYVLPLTESKKNEIRRAVAQEAGHDESLAGHYFTREMLKAALSGWKGFYDVSGKAIPFSAKAVEEMCDCDPEFMGALALRCIAVARAGELVEEKN